MSEAADASFREPPQGPLDQVWVGFLMGVAVNLIAAGVLNTANLDSYTALMLLAGFGMIQLAWMLPLLMVVGRRWRAQKGIVLAMGTTFLLSTTCFLWAPLFA